MLMALRKGRQKQDFEATFLKLVEEDNLLMVCQLLNDTDVPKKFITERLLNKAMQIAIQIGSESVVKLILDEKVNPNLAMFIAVDDHEILQTLISYGGGVNLKNHFGETPLLISTKKRNVESIEILLAHGADISAKNNSGQNILFYAAGQNIGWNGTLRYLLNMRQFDINEKDNFGNNVLQFWNDVENRMQHATCDTVAVSLLYGVKVEGNINFDCSCKYGIFERECDVSKYLAKISNLNPMYYLKVTEQLGIPIEETEFLLSKISVPLTEEIEEMRRTRIYPGRNLTTFFFGNRKIASKFVKNQNIKHLRNIHSDDFTDQFPILGELLNVQVRAADVRTKIQEEWLRKFEICIANYKVRSENLEKIISFLNLADMKNVISTKNLVKTL